jgi:hypothetical protein
VVTAPDTALAFLCGFVIDLGYVYWMRYVADGKRGRAALASMLVTAPMLVGITSVVHNGLLAIPYLCGLGVGTYIATPKREEDESV